MTQYDGKQSLAIPVGFVPIYLKVIDVLEMLGGKFSTTEAH